LDRLQDFADKTKAKEVTVESLVAAKVVKKTDLIKILGRGELKSKLTVKVHAYTASAKAAIEKAGGTTETV
jgi:large subunit ribosomal protein L15